MSLVSTGRPGYWNISCSSAAKGNDPGYKVEISGTRQPGLCFFISCSLIRRSIIGQHCPNLETNLQVSNGVITLLLSGYAARAGVEEVVDGVGEGTRGEGQVVLEVGCGGVRDTQLAQVEELVTSVLAVTQLE